MSTTSGIERGVTIDQLAAYPMDDGNRYELIDGELHVTTQPHLEHQRIMRKLVYLLTAWDLRSGAGETHIAPGVIFSEQDAVAPDLVWVSAARAQAIAHQDDGKLHGAPELVIEVLSQGSANERRDRETKLTLYDRYGITEYWIVDRFARQVTVYRRETSRL
ncbi:MAG: Uma2 family endonuclease, partial [Chloroflexales bacterium]|nr:Uma2 family endonuclease [Chloroflexales bacterium]